MSNLTSINFLLNHNDIEDPASSNQSMSEFINLTSELIESDIED
ncbi:22213_t:CDS:1, partial [Gigaspora rosea]